ncbi:MAG: hypothetical protein IT458_18530 [Planctomycetes bacterium]|nr:hypothetical protein [Planctomycetota bacterium]
MTSDPRTAAAALRRCLALLLPVLLAGCTSLGMDLPEGFLRLHASGWRAVSADDARLWVREFDDPERGTLAFWAATLTEEFTRNRGYAPVGASEVQDKAGRTGRLMEFAATVDGERCGYLIAVWSLGSKLRTVEFTARDEVYRRHVAAVRQGLATVR